MHGHCHFAFGNFKRSKTVSMRTTVGYNRINIFIGPLVFLYFLFLYVITQSRGVTSPPRYLE